MRRGQIVGIILIMIVFVASFASVAIPEWNVPFTNSTKGSQETPLGPVSYTHLTLPTTPSV